VKTFITKSGAIAYIVIIVLAIIFNMLGFSIIDAIISNVSKVLYFIILICAIISIYQSKKKNTITLIFIFLPIFLLFTGIPFKVVTMVIVCSLFFFKDINTAIRAIGILIYTIFIAIGILGLLIGELGANTIVDQQYSPNKVYKTVTIDNDQGALGGNTYIQLERTYFGIAKRHIKTLYLGRWGEKPKIIWIDKSIVSINGREVDIYTSETWDTRN
jgi:uncharacterized membrane protein YtjA (UPF0391 family)